MDYKLYYAYKSKLPKNLEKNYISVQLWCFLKDIKVHIMYMSDSLCFIAI